MDRNRKLTWRPQLEALESRWCPACDVHLIGSALFITGDSSSNQIAILGDGAGTLSIECDGVPGEFTQTIDRVVIRTGNGNDSVFVSDYDFEFDGGISRHWLIDLGDGNDGAGVFLLGLLDEPASITVSGGAGNDSVFVSPAAEFPATFSVSIAAGDGNDSIFHLASGGVSNTMVVALSGGNGDDMIFDFYDSFRVNGTFVGLSDGGNGADSMSVGLGSLAELYPNLPPIVFGFDVAIGGHANYAMLGGNGNDSVFGSFFGRTDGQFGFDVEAGNGDDEISADLNVHVESTGEFTASQRGGNGNDSIGVNVTFYETELVEVVPGVFLEALAGLSETPAPLSHRSIVADGGNGFDSCLHSDWVTLFSIEDDQAR